MHSRLECHFNECDRDGKDHQWDSCGRDGSVAAVDKGTFRHQVGLVLGPPVVSGHRWSPPARMVLLLSLKGQAHDMEPLGEESTELCAAQRLQPQWLCPVYWQGQMVPRVVF